MNRLDRAHFMATVAFDAIFVVNMRLSILDADGFGRAAFSALAAADADALFHLGPLAQRP